MKTAKEKDQVSNKEKSKSPRRAYEESFKRRVVECVIIEGKSLRVAAQLYNLPHSSLRDQALKYLST